MLRKTVLLMASSLCSSTHVHSMEKNALLKWTQCYKVEDITQIHIKDNQNQEISEDGIFQFEDFDSLDHNRIKMTYRCRFSSDTNLHSSCSGQIIIDPLKGLETQSYEHYNRALFPIVKKKLFSKQLKRHLTTEYCEKTVKALNTIRIKNNLPLLTTSGKSFLYNKEHIAIGFISTNPGLCWYVCFGAKPLAFSKNNNNCRPLLAIPHLDLEKRFIPLVNANCDILLFFENGRIAKITPQRFPIKRNKNNDIFFRWN